MSHSIQRQLLKSKISHIEINVLNYSESIRFYDKVLPPMGLNRTNCMTTWTAYSDGQSKFIICPVDDRFQSENFHRKKTGLNHLAFFAPSKQAVNDFHNNVLLKQSITCLYEGKPDGNDEYYAVFFETPDRLKLEYVYAPNYCNPDTFPTNMTDDFDPYAK